jgi:hypothetical protein
MKRVLTIAAIAIFNLIGFTSFGQSLNFSGGFNSSTIKMEGMTDGTSTEVYGGTTYTSSEDYKRIGGFNASIGYEFRLGERLSLETGLKFQTRGYKLESSISYQSDMYSYRESYDLKYKLNYLDLPVVLNVAILTGDVRVYARAGLYAGIMTGGKYAIKSEYSYSDGDYVVSDDTETFSGSDFDEDRYTGGFIFGAGVEYKGVYFETNYSIGAMSLASIDDESYTHDFSLSLGYKLKFKK